MKFFVVCKLSFAASAFLLGNGLVFAQANLSSALHVNQWVRQSETKALTGSIVVPQSNGASSNVKAGVVTLVGDDGKVRNAKTDASGVFSFESVETGIYSLTARANDAYSVVALHVVERSKDGAELLPESVVMPAAVIDFVTLHSAVVRYLPPSTIAPSQFSMSTAKIDDLAAKVVGTELFRVVQTAGGMNGQIFTAGAYGGTLPAAADTNVFILRDGEEVARTVTAQDGTFRIDSLPLGKYSILACGPAGLGLIGAELIDEQEARAMAKVTKEGETLITLLQGSPCDVCSMQVASVPSVSETIISDTVISETVVGEDVVGTGFGDPLTAGYGGGGFAGGGGGFGGGGGGFGGGGGLGLLLAGGIAAAAIAASDDDDNLPPTPAPSSPQGL